MKFKLEFDCDNAAFEGVQYWNDHVVKDKRQVTRAMRRVAKKLRGQ